MQVHISYSKNSEMEVIKVNRLRMQCPIFIHTRTQYKENKAERDRVVK